MEIVRNFINLSGLADPDELYNLGNRRPIQYSAAETIYIPKNQPDIKSIFQIIIKAEIKSCRNITTPVGNTVVIDGVKKLKIIYTQSDVSGKANLIDLELPFNTFLKLQKFTDPSDIQIHVLDAYFSLLDERKIYSHFVYMISVTESPAEFRKASDLIRDICAENMEEAVLIDLDA